MTDSVAEPHNPWPRGMAILLAVGGSFWGIWLMVLATPLIILYPLFTPGYLITAGYIVRAVSRPSLWKRRAIWGASFVIQGTWLIAGFGHGLFTAWWAFATFGSLIALYHEQEDTYPEPAAHLNPPI